MPGFLNYVKRTSSEMLPRGKRLVANHKIWFLQMLHRLFFCNMSCLTTAFMAFLLFAVAACAETILTEADNGKTVRLAPQEEVMIALSANPTTGYSWEMVEQGADAAVIVVASEFRPSAGSPERVGAGGVEYFRLRLRKAGRFPVTLVYRRSWEKEKEPERIFRIILEEQ